MAQDIDSRPARPPELYWDVKKVLLATVILGLFGFFASWIIFYGLTLGLNVSRNKADIWLYVIPGGCVAFAFFGTLYFAHVERRRLLDFYRKDEDG